MVHRLRRLTVGYGMYILGILGGVIVFGLLAVHHVPHCSRVKRKKDEPSAHHEENAASR